ncbi:MAG: helix-turn-helix transcriptional regulator [Planctomycetota bacterium]
MQPFWLAYLFVAFAVGVACLGVTVGVAMRRKDATARAFVAFHAAFCVMVTASLVLAFADLAPGAISGPVQFVFEYLQTIVGYYGVMLTMPLLVHRVFGVEDRRRERILIAVILTTLGLQHVTEFALGSTPWDERGDWFEDGVLTAVVAYAFWTAYTRLGAPEAERPLATRIFALLVLGTPGIFTDVFFSDDWGVRVYPLWYGATSLVVAWTLLRSEPQTQIQTQTQTQIQTQTQTQNTAEPAATSCLAVEPRVADGWGLSAREAEVADWVARGLSNKDIAAALHISPNTVKTHLRTIFEKAGIRSRFELIAQMRGERIAPPAEE